MTRALADLQVPGLADEAEISHRALAALPAPQRGVFGGEARLNVAVAGGPRQQVLRPAEIEDRALISDLHRESMFGPNAPLDPASATQPSVNGDWLEITQERAAVSVHVDGTVSSRVPPQRRTLAAANCWPALWKKTYMTASVAHCGSLSKYSNDSTMPVGSAASRRAQSCVMPATRHG